MYRGGGQGLLQDDDGLDDVLEGRGGGGGRGGRGGRSGPPNKKRMSKDKKFGFGGPKRKLKQTDSRSLNDLTSFNPKKGKVSGRGGGGAGGRKGAKKGKGGNRPGKTARTKMRTQKRG